MATAVKVYDSVKREMQERCFLPLAGDKTTVVSMVVGATEDVAQLIGPCAKVGAWCEKLGVDYALVAAAEEAATLG